MKTKLFLLLGLFVTLQMPLLTACDDDNDIDILQTQVPAEVMTTFKEMFPNILFAEWERDKISNHYKADFIDENREKEACFQADGQWVYTKIDLNSLELPKAVTDYVTTNHPDRYIDDADLFTTPTQKYYLLELDRANHQDIYIKLTESGELIP